MEKKTIHNKLGKRLYGAGIHMTALDGTIDLDLKTFADENKFSFSMAGEG